MMLACLKQYLRHKLRDPSHEENSRVPHSSPPSGAAKGRHTRWDDSGGRQVHSKLGCLQVVTPQLSVLLTSVPVEVPPESANIRRDTETRGTVTSEDSLASKIARRNPGAGGEGSVRGGGGETDTKADTVDHAFKLLYTLAPKVAVTSFKRDSYTRVHCHLFTQP